MQGADRLQQALKKQKTKQNKKPANYDETAFTVMLFSS